jgi:hypothetical protein
MSNYCRGILITLTRRTPLLFAHLHPFTKPLSVAVVEKVTVGKVARPRYNHLAVSALETDFM